MSRSVLRRWRDHTRTSADRMARRGSVAAAARVLERLIAHPFPSISRAAPPVVDGKWPCARGDRGLARRVPSPARRRSGSLATTSFRSAEQAEGGAEARGFDATSIDGPVGEFERRVRAGDLVDGDARQAVALRQLQALRDRLVASHLANASSPLPAQGVYLHGGVGRGKTMLMDAFHATLPPGLASRARRVHFHEFMAEVHRRLHAARGVGVDPLAAVAAAIHAESPIICFDEVELVDIADALVFKRVFERVFQLGGVVVATSNTAPEQLYEGGINRDVFAPFIATLRERCAVVSLDHVRAWLGPRHPDSAHERLSVGSGTDADPDSHPRGRDEAAEDASSDVDYRALASRRRSASESTTTTRALPSAIAGCPSMLSIVSDPVEGRVVVDRAWAAAAAARDASVAAAKPSSIPVSAGRSILAPLVVGTAARFNFDDLCGARARLGAADYVALLDRFDLIAVDGVPTFGPEDEDVARRFVNLVDVLYERRALLVASLAAAPVDLFRGDNDADGERETVREATRGRVRAEGARGGHGATVTGEGGSSGRSTTVVGNMEWSATGRVGASLADLQRVNFTFRASRRCVSRLMEMGSGGWERKWVSGCNRRTSDFLQLNHD